MAARRVAQPRHRSWAWTSTCVALAMGLQGCLASTQQEVELGRQYSEQVERQLPMVQDPAVRQYLQSLGDSIARHADDRSLVWSFSVVDQDQINAFAVPGGHIYVYRGLIERMRSMSELAGVLGHEIAHVTRRHSMQQLRDRQRAAVGVTVGCIIAPQFCQSETGSAVLNLGSGAAFAKFSRDDEAEADRYGVTYAAQAGIDPRGIPSMFEVLLAERSRNPSGLAAFFASHPIEEQRITATNAAIAALDPHQLSGLRGDTPAFQAFKARIAALPRPPAKKQ